MKITQNNLDHLDLLGAFERIPVLSTVSSIALLVLKIVPTSEKFQRTFTAKVIDQVPISRCLLLLIPIIGNLIILLIDSARDENDLIIEKYLASNRLDLAEPLIIEELRFHNKKPLKKLAVYQIENKYYAAADLTLKILGFEKHLENYLSGEDTALYDLGVVLNHLPYIQAMAGKNMPLACWEMGLHLEKSDQKQALEYFHKGAAGIIGTYGVAMCQYKIGIIENNKSYLWKAAKSYNLDAILELEKSDPNNQELKKLKKTKLTTK